MEGMRESAATSIHGSVRTSLTRACRPSHPWLDRGIRKKRLWLAEARGSEEQGRGVARSGIMAGGGF